MEGEIFEFKGQSWFISIVQNHMCPDQSNKGRMIEKAFNRNIEGEGEIVKFGQKNGKIVIQFASSYYTVDVWIIQRQAKWGCGFLCKIDKSTYNINEIWCLVNYLYWKR